MDRRILNSLRASLLDRINLSSIPVEVWKRSSALNTWGTNAIEGSTITWKDARSILLKDRSVRNRSIGDVLETVQHDRAFSGLLDRMGAPITLETVLELHDEVFWGVHPDAGMWRNVNVRIGGGRFTPPRMEKVVYLMDELICEYRRRDTEGEDVFLLGSLFHHRFEIIHPFRDGNGRVGRLLLNLHLLKHNWPPIHILPADRVEYINSLDSANDGDLMPLSSLLERLMGSSLVDLLDGVGRSEDELIDLKEASFLVPYDPKYLGLRCGQGELPGVLTGHRWMTSKRSLDTYMDTIGRK